MHEALRGIRLVSCAALVLVLVGCSNSSGEVRTDSTNVPSAPSSSASNPSATAPKPSEASPKTDTEAAAQSASALVRRYYNVRDALRKDPQLPLRKLAGVAVSMELAAEQDLFKRERRDGLHQTGDTRIAKLRVESVNLDNSAPRAGRVPTVQVDVCYDVSGVDVVDSTGKSVVSKDRSDTGWVRYSVSNYKWRSDPQHGWRVASGQDLEREACAAS